MTDVLDDLADITECTVDGKTFDEIIPEIYRMVYYYVNVYYHKYTILKANLHDMNDVAQDMFVSIRNKKDKKGFSNIQKKFIKASKENLGMKYISNTIGKTVRLNIMSLARTFSRRPIGVSFETLSKIYSNGDSGEDVADHFDFLEDKTQDVNLKSAYDFIINSIEDISYRDYYVIKENKKVSLSIHTVLNMVTDGLTISEMSEKVYMYSKDTNISYKRMNEIVKESRKIAKDSYDNGSCLYELF